MEICLIGDDTQLPWGPFSLPVYVKRAIERAGIDCSHFISQADVDLQRDSIDPSLYLFVDDSNHFPLIEPSNRPSAIWLTDSHAGGLPARMRWAESADFVFACHLSGVEKLSLDLQREVHWLPVACDPERHAKGAQPPGHRTKEVVFVGNFGTTSTGEFGLRSEWIKAAEQICADLDIHFHFSQKYAEDAFEPYKRALVALNFPCNHDLNMRVFEAIAGGAYLLTQPIEMAAMEKIGLQKGIHYETFDDTDELRDRLAIQIQHQSGLSALGNLARNIILERHTYDHRLKQILETCGLAV